MSGSRSTTAERLRSRRKQAGTAGASTPVPQHTRKIAELWSDAAAKMSPSDVDEAWARLLEETLSPDKREALDRSYAAETDPSMRYNMLLEFSSYLRQVPAALSTSLAKPPWLRLRDPDRAASFAGGRACGRSRWGKRDGPGGRRHQPHMGDWARSVHRGVGAPPPPPHASALHAPLRRRPPLPCSLGRCCRSCSVLLSSWGNW